MNNCPNCGSSLKQGENSCKVCGSKILLTQTNPYEYQQVNNQSVNYQQSVNSNSTIQEFQYPTNNIINDSNLIDSYIGKNAEKIKKGDFSVCVFFFGALYVLYRKMWLLGFLWLVINVLANMFLTSLASIISIAVNIIIAIKFNKLYLKHVEEEVNKIKSENPGKSQEQLMMLCSKKGGTNLIPVIVVIIFYGAIFLLIFISIISMLVESRKNIEKDYNINTNPTPIYETIGNLDVTIPNILVESEISSEDYKVYNNNDYSCSLKLDIDKYSDDAKQSLESNIYYSASDTYSGIVPKNINGNSWYYASVITGYNQTYYFSTSNNDSTYMVEFSISNIADKTCSSAYDTVINSLKFD